MAEPIPGKKLYFIVVSAHEFDLRIEIARWAKSPGPLSNFFNPIIDLVSDPKGVWETGHEHKLPPIGIQNIKDMVNGISRTCDFSRGRVSTLEIIGHGDNGGQWVGSDWLGTMVDPFTGMESLSLSIHSADLLRLRPYFTANAKVKLGGCKVGTNEKLVSGLSKLWPGVTVIGNTANQRPLLPGDEGGARVCKDSRCVYSGPGAFDHLDRALGL